MLSLWFDFGIQWIHLLFEVLHLVHSSLQCLFIEGFILVIGILEALVLVPQVQELLIHMIVVFPHTLHLSYDISLIVCISAALTIPSEPLLLVPATLWRLLRKSLTWEPADAYLLLCRWSIIILKLLMIPAWCQYLVLVRYTRGHVVNAADDLFWITHKLPFSVHLRLVQNWLSGVCVLDYRLCEVLSLLLLLGSAF